METNYFFDVDENCKKLILQCLDELKELNFPIPTSVYFRKGRGISTYGMCYKGKYFKKYKNYDFVISINENLISEKDIKDTIIHELLHTVDFSAAHSGAWKTWAEHINKKTEYNISRTSKCVLNPAAINGYEQKKQISSANLVTVTCPVCHNVISLRQKVHFDKRGACDYYCKKCRMNYYNALPNSPMKYFTDAEKEDFIDNISPTTELDKEAILNSLPFLNKSLRNKLIMHLFNTKIELFLSLKETFNFIYPILYICDKSVATYMADMYINNQIERLKVMTDCEYLAFSGLFAMTDNYVRVTEHWNFLKSNI